MAEGEGKAKVTVKTSRKKETVEVDLHSTVGEVSHILSVCKDPDEEKRVISFLRCDMSFPLQFKDVVSSAFDDTPKQQLCLIFSGKILKDDQTLDTYGGLDHVASFFVEFSLSCSTCEGLHVSSQRCSCCLHRDLAVVQCPFCARGEQPPFGLCIILTENLCEFTASAAHGLLGHCHVNSGGQLRNYPCGILPRSQRKFSFILLIWHTESVDG